MALQAARLTEDRRKAEEARQEARAAADSAGTRVLQLEQRVGQLSADKQAAAQVCVVVVAQTYGTDIRQEGGFRMGCLHCSCWWHQ